VTRWITRLLLHQVVSELEIHLYISGEARRQKKTERWRLCDDCLQVGHNQEDSQGDWKMRLVELLVQSDSSRFSRRANRDITMVIEGHRHAGKKSKTEKLAEMDKELYELKAKIEKLELRMRQDKKMVQVCELETGRGLDDEEDELGSAEDLKNCQEGREKIPDF
jgi:hypothetical protein